MSSGRRPVAVESVVSIDVELNAIDDQIAQLKCRRQQLVERRENLVETEATRAAQLQQEGMSSRWETEEFEWSTRLAAARKKTFRLDQFRPYQLSAINASLSRQDVLLVMSTGGGKSLAYQLPAVISKGITLVISPLISLMEDQIWNLRNFGVEAEMLSANCSQAETSRIQKATLSAATSGFRLLYVTPEKLAKSRRFMASLEKVYRAGLLDRVAIDEVHCASQWGNDFRPDYKFLNILKRQFPETPIIGLTATATARVIDDVKKILGIPGALVFQAGFNRANLFYEVRPKSGVAADFHSELATLIRTRFPRQSGIVYCFSRKESEEVALGLCAKGIAARFYHADLPLPERSETHRLWTSDECQVVVATVAFGMGIDKPDVRFVIHQSLPKSLENYYQESGRCGRDGQPASCFLYYRLADVFRQSSMVCTEQTGTKNLYAVVNYCLNASECRRKVLAKHFGVEWDASWCRQMCDICAAEPRQGDSLVDVTDHCHQLLKILKENGENQKLTAAKLIDLWFKQMKSDRKVKSTGVEEQLSRGRCELVLATLLHSGYLQEIFHFTPYNVISYMGPGQRASLLRGNLQAERILVDLPLPLETDRMESTPRGRKRAAEASAEGMKRRKSPVARQSASATIELSDDE